MKRHQIMREIRHSISQNTISFLVEKIFDFKVDRCPKLYKTVFAAPELREKCSAKFEVFTSLPKMTSHKPSLAEILNINIFHITQYFWVKVTNVISGTYRTF